MEWDYCECCTPCPWPSFSRSNIFLCIYKKLRKKSCPSRFASTRTALTVELVLLYLTWSVNLTYFSPSILRCMCMWCSCPYCLTFYAIIFWQNRSFSLLISLCVERTIYAKKSRLTLPVVVRVQPATFRTAATDVYRLGYRGLFDRHRSTVSHWRWTRSNVASSSAARRKWNLLPAAVRAASSAGNSFPAAVRAAKRVRNTLLVAPSVYTD